MSWDKARDSATDHKVSPGSTTQVVGVATDRVSEASAVPTNQPPTSDARPHNTYNAVTNNNTAITRRRRYSDGSGDGAVFAVVGSDLDEVWDAGAIAGEVTADAGGSGEGLKVVELNGVAEVIARAMDLILLMGCDSFDSAGWRPGLAAGVSARYRLILRVLRYQPERLDGEHSFGKHVFTERPFACG